ncbi:MAG: cytochrome c3 family protein [Desulfuromonadaceae bacterium]|nr:cytochrome c3 family protein [Desulfuromonadaceae bacterium]
MRKQWLVFIVVLLTGFTLWGCGSDRGSDSSSVTPIAPVADAAKSGNCKLCHTLDVHTAFSALVGQNPDTTLGLGSAIKHDCEDCHGGGQYHRGVGPIPYPAPEITRCETCHTQATKVIASKHTNGRGHDTEAVCQRCHTAEGAFEFANYTGDKDVNLLNTGTALVSVNGNTCGACHDPLNGTMREVAGWDPNANGTADQFDLCTSCHTYYNKDGLLVGSGSLASRTAPYYHNTSWYRTITTTHFDDPATSYEVADAAAVCDDADPTYDAAACSALNAIEGYVLRETGDNPCFDCHGHELRTNTRRHLDAPTDADRGPTIHTDWANSRHGGELLKAKVAAAVANPQTGTRGSDEYTTSGITQVDAVMAAGREDGVGHGWSWTHYPWDKTNDTVAGDRTGRADCQRCHTSTGVSNFLTAPDTYDPANNDFSHLVNWNATDGSPQSEMLYCWGCHVSVDTGELRDPGALTIDYSNNASVTFPDSAASNVCIACHSGRENGDSIKKDTSTTGVRSFLNSHYLNAGGILFAKGGYEYDSMNYDFAAGDRHQNIGYGSATPTGDANFDAVSDDYTSGPCVTCHFDSSDVNGLDRSHTLSPFTETVADGTVLNSVCVKCHTARGVGDSANKWFGKDFVEADFVAARETWDLDNTKQPPHKGRLLAAQLTLQNVLASKGILTDFSAYPYFFADSGYGEGIADNGILEAGEVNRLNGFTNWASIYGLDQWKNVMGAAFNLNLIAHDPGATAHNRRYARRLIYDSIDFMDDGIMNDSTKATVTAQAQLYEPFALNYIGSRP